MARSRFFNGISLNSSLVLLVLFHCFFFQISCTLNANISELDSAPSSNLTPKPGASEIHFENGTELNVLNGDEINLSVIGAQGVVSFKDQGSGFVSATSGKYSPLLGTSVTVETVEAVDSVSSAVAKIKINIQKMVSISNLSNLITLDPASSRDGVRALGKAPNGTLWVAYRYYYDWIVAKSLDNGTTYIIADIFPSTDSGYQSSSPNAIVIKDNLTIFVVGHSSGPDNNQKFIVRRTLDGGQTWSNVDIVGDFTTGFGLSFNSAKSISITNSGTLLVSGDQCLGCYPNFTWIVRRSTDNGNSWTTVSSIAGNAGPITVDPVTGNSYVVGKTSSGQIRVLKSVNDGVTWTQVDAYNPINGYSDLNGISARNGTIIFSGSDRGNVASSNGCNGTSWFTGFTQNRFWFSRLSKDDGATWATSEYIKISGTDSLSLGVAINSAGVIFTSGVYFNYGTCQTFPVVRSSLDGITFTTVDSPAVAATYENYLGSLYIDNTNVIYNYGTLVSRMSSGAYNIRTNFRRSLDGGTTWTNHLVNPSLPEGTTAKIITKDSSENVYASVDSTFFTFYRRSSDSGKTWSDLGYLPYPSGYYYTTSAGLVVLPGNSMVALGSAQASSKYHWYAFKSTDAGVTWTMTDDFYSAAGNYYTPSGLVVDASNTIYASGYAAVTSFNSGAHAEYIRKSTDSGTTWTPAYTFIYAPGKTTMNVGLYVDKNNSLYSLSNAYDSSNLSHCVVRKSSDGAASWSVVNDIGEAKTTTGGMVSCNDMLVDDQGAIYLSYSYYNTGAGPYTYTAAIAKSSDSGASWSVIFQKTSQNSYSNLKLAKVNGTLNVNLVFYDAITENPLSEIWRTRDGSNWNLIERSSNLKSDIMECRAPGANESKLCAVGTLPSILSFSTIWSFFSH